MTVTGITMITCDACGKHQSSVEKRFSSSVPDGWAAIELDWRDLAEDKTVYEEWHLCPACTGDLLSAIVRHRQESAQEHT